MEIVVGLEDTSIEETPKSMEEKDSKIWSEKKKKKKKREGSWHMSWKGKMLFIYLFMKNNIFRNEFGVGGQVEKLI